MHGRGTCQCTAFPNTGLTVACDLVPLRSHIGTLSLGIRHMHFFCVLLAENGLVTKWRNKSKVSDGKIRGIVSSGGIPIVMQEHFISKEGCLPFRSAVQVHPTPHPESFLTILSSIKFPPAMHTDIALTHAINHAGDLRDCGGC